MSYGHYWHFQCDSWCLPTQKRLKNATNDISIQEFHNIITHYKRHYMKAIVLSTPPWGTHQLQGIPY